MNACFGWMFSLISLFLMSNLVNEITEERNKSNLSKEQVEIFFDYVKGHSFDKIRASYGLSCNNVVIRVVIRTIQLKHWYFNHKGGNDPYLSKKDLDTFCDSICSYADDINCITCSCSIQLAHDIKNTRIKKAILFLHSIQKDNLIHHLENRGPPCREWIYEIISKLDLKIVSSQSLEYGRRFFCDYDSIIEYFMIYGELFERDDRLILNMDETSLSARKRMKVIARKNQIPLLLESPKIPHLTGVITVSASGQYFRPIIVLPNKKTLRKLEDFEDKCYFFSTSSGWMTKKGFLYYCLILISDLQRYRLTLNPKIQDEPFLLILDGHTSHISFLSAYLLYVFNIDLLLIPAHTSHLLSPFDVSIASPLKTYFSNDLNNMNYSTDGSVKKNLAYFRTFSIDSFLNSSVRACSPNNIRSGFRAAGISPLNPNKPLTSDYAMENPGVYQNRANNNLPTYYLNSEFGLNYLFYEENKRNLNQNDLDTSLQQIFDLLTNNLDITTGIPLSHIPDILTELDSPYIRRIKINVGV